MKKPPLHRVHRQMGARMVEFAGWEMPLQYTGIIAEHKAVRSRVGLFDVSHMGELEVRGKGAFEFCQSITCNDLAKVGALQAQYTLLLNDSGGIVDDVIVTKLSDGGFLFCTNASNTGKDFCWMNDRKKPGVEILDRSEEYALLAIQGPRSCTVLERITGIPIADLTRFRCALGKVAGVDALVSRTGYTGEDGFEIYLPWGQAETVWGALVEVGKAHGIAAAGLGARDTLRMEKGYCLHGHEIDEGTSPLEAGLEWVVAWTKRAFVGRDALQAKRLEVQRRLIGFEMVGGGIPRRDCGLFFEEQEVGHVTSGGFSPSLEKGIGLAYGRIEWTAPGTLLDIAIRQRRSKCQVVEMPLYPPRPLEM